MHTPHWFIIVPHSAFQYEHTAVNSECVLERRATPETFSEFLYSCILNFSLISIKSILEIYTIVHCDDNGRYSGNMLCHELQGMSD